MNKELEWLEDKGKLSKPYKPPASKPAPAEQVPESERYIPKKGEGKKRIRSVRRQNADPTKIGGVVNGVLNGLKDQPA